MIDPVTESIAPTQDRTRALFEPVFLNAMRHLMQGAIFLASFLVIELGLTNLAKFILNPHNFVVLTIIDGLEIFSALGVAFLFIIHFAKVSRHYIMEL